MAMYLSMATPFGNRDDAKFNKIGAFTEGGDTIFTPVQVSDTHYSFVPGPEFCPRLYRGQSTDYGTCKAGLFRKGIKYGDLIFWKLKQIELLALFERHPATIEMSSHWTISGLRLQMSLNAMAQHYGYKTDIIDLTRSRNVAMFFATHRFFNGAWVPAIGQNAVLYTIAFSELAAHHHGLFPIGIEPFPRPYAQRAFGLQLGMADDLVNLSGVTAENFTVTPEIVSETLQRVGGITGIFPRDPFELLIDEQAARRSVSLDSIGRAYVMGQMPAALNYGDVAFHLKEAGYSISRSPIKLPNADLLATAEVSWKKLRQEFLRDIRVRFVGEHINTGRVAF